MNASPLGAVLVCDATEHRQWRITTCDETFSELSGVSFSSLLGRDLNTILHPAPVLHDSADRCRLQHSTHWFAYAPDLPPVVMTTTILPGEVSVRSGTVSGHLQSGQVLRVACHFSRRALPALGSQTSSLPTSCVPCSPLFYDTAAYDKSLYVHTWSMATNASESPSRAMPKPPRFESKLPSSAMPSSRKPPLAPDPPRSRSLESASSASCAVTCTTGARSNIDPASCCPPSLQVQQETLQVSESPVSSSWSNLQCAGDGAAAPHCGTRPRPQEGDAPAIPNEMGSRSLFLANMSHELRTPLNGTVAIVELLLGTNVSPEQRDLLKTVLESSQSLTRILSSILDFAQLDSGLVELSQDPLNICDIVESCIDMVWPDALKKGLEVTVSAPRVAMINNVLGDGLRIRQILVHLLSNAVKFTDQGSVEVEVEAVETATEMQCALKVKDTGIGVPDSFRPFLFDSFTQATESCTRTHGGLGLGLAICCNLARLMHADLKITNRDGGGSTATLSLCMARVATSSASSNGDLDSSAFTAEGAEPKDGLQSPTYSSSTGSRNSLDSTDSSAGAPSSREKSADSSNYEPQRASASKAANTSMCLRDSDISIPKLLSDPRVGLLQRHTAVIHTHSMGVSQQLRCALSALGMAVIDMPVMRCPQSLDEYTMDQRDCEQLRGTPILFCSATDAAPALRSGWKKRPVVALCADGRLPHALRVYVTPVAMPVKFRELTSAALLALHGGPGKDSLLHVPLGTPKPLSASTAGACTAGFGGTACGFCTRCQLTSDATTAAALHRRSLDNSALERFPQRLSMSTTCLEAVVEANDSSQSCHSCASSESGWAATENSALEASRSENSSTSMGADSRSKGEFVMSAGTESDASGMCRSSAAAGTSSAGSLQQHGSSLESHKLPIEALSGDSSTSPVRPVVQGKVSATAAAAVAASAPTAAEAAAGSQSVCAATAMLGAQMQQQQRGTYTEPVFAVPVLSSNACAQPGSTAPTMRRSVSASGIAQRTTAERIRHQQQKDQGHTYGGVAMQSFLYRSAKQNTAVCSGDTSSSGLDRRGGSSCLETEGPSPRSPLNFTAHPSTTSRKFPTVQGSPKAHPKSGAKRLRLLVAEDNKINQLVVQKVVRKAHPTCDIDVVENGEAALLAILERPGYDLVLMDIHMPKMDGLETTRRVRESHPTRPMIVALTADTVVGMRQKCLQAGMQDYITKPFHVKDMERILQYFQQ